MKHLLTLGFFALTILGQSQVLNYNFSTFTNEYSDLTNPIVLTTETWDDPELVVPIGFDFLFEGASYNELYIGYGLGGFIIFQNGATLANAIIATSADIIDVGYNDGEVMSPISYQVSGTPGSQICKIEWKNCGFYNQAEEGIFPDRVSFQLWIYEGSNDFEIRYGQNTVKDFSVYDGWLTHGILQNASLVSNELGYGHVLSGSTNAPTLVSSSDEMTLFTATLDATPENGRVYRFASTIVSAPELINESTLNVFPTVTDGFVTVNSNLDSPVQIDVLSISGQILMQTSVTRSLQLDLSGLSAGCYFVRLVDSNQTVKVIKQ